MPLPTSAPQTAETAYRLVIATAQTCSVNLRGLKGLIDAGARVPLVALVGLYQALNGSQGVGRSIQGVEGLAEYAKEALQAPDYDIDAEFMRSIIACKAVTDWLLANLPNDGAGGYVGWTHEGDGQIVPLTVAADTLAPLAALIDTALATFA
ncbi:hypothetical protein [Methylobacterium sp. CM6246]